jgi:hypothetical protein
MTVAMLSASAVSDSQRNNRAGGAGGLTAGLVVTRPERFDRRESASARRQVEFCTNNLYQRPLNHPAVTATDAPRIACAHVRAGKPREMCNDGVICARAVPEARRGRQTEERSDEGPLSGRGELELSWAQRGPPIRSRLRSLCRGLGNLAPRRRQSSTRLPPPPIHPCQAASACQREARTRWKGGTTCTRAAD